MAKVVPDAFLDGGLTLDTSLNQVMVCAGQPTSYADCVTRALATTTLTAPTLGAGSPDGRQSNIPAANNITIATSGTGDHVAYRDTVSGTRYFVTTCSSTALVANGSNTVSIGATTRRIGAVT